METTAITTHLAVIAIVTHLETTAITTHLGAFAITTYLGTVVTTSDLHHLKMLLIHTHIIEVITSVITVGILYSKEQKLHLQNLKFRTIIFLKDYKELQVHT